jgi:hypothetical protein
MFAWDHGEVHFARVSVMFLFVFKSIVKEISRQSYLLAWYEQASFEFHPGIWYKFASVNQDGCSGTRVAPFDHFNVAYDVWGCNNKYQNRQRTHGLHQASGFFTLFTGHKCNWISEEHPRMCKLEGRGPVSVIRCTNIKLQCRWALISRKKPKWIAVRRWRNQTSYYCKVVVGPGAQLCTLLEVRVLGVGMSTLDAQTVCTARIGGSKYRCPWSMAPSPPAANPRRGLIRGSGVGFR